MTNNLLTQKPKHLYGFTLVEVLAAVIIGSMVLVTMLAVYSRAQNSAEALRRTLDRISLPRGILQHIAEDLDSMVATGSDAIVIINNKIIQGYPTARLEIRKTIKEEDKEEEFETIVWQSSPDFETDANGLVLYRKHSGIAVEDKLLDKQREDWEKVFPYVPVCSGVTLFSVKVPKGQDFVNKWSGETPPRSVVVTISFAEPFETVEGNWEIPQESKFERIIAIGRTRKVKFKIVPFEQQHTGYEEQPDEQQDIGIEDNNDTSDVGEIIDRGDTETESGAEKI